VLYIYIYMPMLPLPPRQEKLATPMFLPPMRKSAPVNVSDRPTEQIKC